ncbi:MAG TPA: prepilin peptidase [Spirochaetales bacterium]|nr:prepilin peptidase [Spirochaetales bacterium]
MQVPYPASILGNQKERTDSKINIVEGLISIPFLASILYYDIKEKKIPDLFTYSGMLVILIVRLLQGYFSPWYLIDAFVGFSLIWLFFIFSKGRIGLGDAKLSAFISIIVGVWAWALAIFFASFSGLLFILVMIKLQKMTTKESIPFAPFLVLGGVISFLLKVKIEAFINSIINGI